MDNNGIPVTRVHSYNVSVAADVGINAAVVFYNICFWVEENYANNRNYINGKYWTYNTVKAFRTIFPEMTGKQIEYALKKLKDGGYIESAILSEDTRDRTNWYTVCDFKKWISQNEDIPQEKEVSSENSEMASEDSGLFNNIYNNKNTDTDNKQSDNKPTNNSHKGKNINSVNAKVKTSLSERKQMPKSAKQRYLDMKSNEIDMLNRVYNICQENYDEPIADEIYNTIEHYFEKYTEKTDKIHPILTDNTLRDIIERMANFSDTEYEHFENVIGQPGVFIKIIDSYFGGDYGSMKGYETNWHLPHFMSEGVLNRLTQRLWEIGEVY